MNDKVITFSQSDHLELYDWFVDQIWIINVFIRIFKY